MQLFSKPLDAITPEDIQRLVSEGVPEGSLVEFKRELPANKGADPWEAGAEQIGDKARNEILEEVVAFANAHGGHLLIGIAETTDSPPRAARALGVARCAALAEKLRLQARDCIEPQVPVLSTAGVVTGPDGRGVVVIRVPQSRSAPHRLKQTRECYYRRADRSEKMTMREIQDLTLNRDRGAQVVGRQFEDLQQRFARVVAATPAGEHPVIGIRTTAVPVSSELFVQHVHNNPKVAPAYERIDVRASGAPLDVGWPSFSGSARPILRGTRFERGDPKGEIYREVYCSGVVEFGLHFVMEPPRQRMLYPDWVLALAFNTMLTAHKFRIAAGAPDVEYGFELEIASPGGKLPVTQVAARIFIDAIGHIGPDRVIYPRLSLGPTSEFPTVVSVMLNDLWNSAGIEGGSELTFSFGAALAKVEST